MTVAGRAVVPLTDAGAGGPAGGGRVVRVRGSVIDVEFDERLPEIDHLLRVATASVGMEVVAHLDARTVRAVALSATRGLARGDEVQDTGAPIRVPVGPADQIR